MITFEELIRNQFEYGGKKYALSGSETRESTDDLFDDFGKSWLFGTMGKYIKRYRNLRLEKDILKIGCYSYITWLKRGFFVDEKRVIPLDTNLEVKKIYFDEFVYRFNKFSNGYEKHSKKIIEKIALDDNNFLNLVYELLVQLTNKDWKETTEDNLFVIFYSMKHIWNENFSQLTEHKTDTGNTNEKLGTI